jgi:UPF0716 protein FxsA
MIGFILLAFLLVPIAEIAVFIEAGQLIGLGWTLAIVVMTAVAGTWLLRRQGLQTLAKTQAKLDRGELPMGELFTGVCLLVAGALLLTPGFITDSIGLALFVPPLREALGYFVLRRLLNSRNSRFWVNGEEVDPRGEPNGQGPVIDGEFTRVPPNDEDDDAPKGLPRQNSPWRRGD